MDLQIPDPDRFILRGGDPKTQLERTSINDIRFFSYPVSVRRNPVTMGIICVFGYITLAFYQSSITVLQSLVVAVGAGLGLWGGINLMEGYGNDNPGSKSQGMKQLMAGGGIALIGTTLVPVLSGLF